LACCGSGGIDSAHVEREHLVVEARGRRRALEDLRRLRLTGVDVSRVELVLVQEARRAARTAQLALGGAPLAWVIVLTVRHVGKRNLFGGLRHAKEQLLCAWRFGRVAVALHETHQKIPVTVHCSEVLLLGARGRLAGQMVPLSKEILQSLLGSGCGGWRHGEAHWPG
jgi:hypothetical protein